MRVKDQRNNYESQDVEEVLNGGEELDVYVAISNRALTIYGHSLFAISSPNLALLNLAYFFEVNDTNWDIICMRLLLGYLFLFFY